MPKICQKCGAALEEGELFCGDCGAKYEEPAASGEQSGAADNAAKSAIYCASCGAEIEEDAEFCPDCGAKAEKSAARTFCPKCGTQTDAGAAFCPKCGYSMQKTAQPAYSPAPKPKKGASKTIIIVAIIAAAAVIITLLLVNFSGKKADKALPAAAQSAIPTAVATFEPTAEPSAEATAEPSATVAPTPSAETTPAPSAIADWPTDALPAPSFGELWKADNDAATGSWYIIVSPATADEVKAYCANELKAAGFTNTVVENGLDGDYDYSFYADNAVDFSVRVGCMAGKMEIYALPLNGNDGGSTSQMTGDWPTGGYAALIPPIPYGYVYYVDDYDNYNIFIENITYDQAADYINNYILNTAFVEDQDIQDDYTAFYYSAFNSDGILFEMSYSDYMAEIYIGETYN